jgi:hypothetical protein
MKRLGIILAAAGFFTSTAEAGFEKIGIGSRALGMGSAFVAVANDASAIYWNPAGMALGRDDSLTTRQFLLMYSPLYGLSYLQHKFAGYTQDRFSKSPYSGALGLGVIELALSPNPEDVQSLNYVENTFLISWAYSFSLHPLLQRISMGATFKYYNLRTAKGAFGYGSDLGFLAKQSLTGSKWKVNWQIGFAVQDVGKSGLWYRGGYSPARREFVEPHYRWGFAMGIEHPSKLLSHVLFSADVHRRDKYALERTEVNLGAELRLLPNFDLRCGIQQLDAPRYAFGFGILSPKSFIARSVLAVEAALLTHPDLNNTLTFSVSIYGGKRP